MDNRISLLSSPYNTAPAMAQARPEETGTGSSQLEQAHETILKEYPKMHSMLVVRSGKLVYEQYYADYHAGSLNDLRSATKSVVSLLTGIAIGRGELSGTHLTVPDALRSYLPAPSDPLLMQLTLRHLLSMTSGFRWITGSKLGEPLVRNLQRSRRWVQFILNLPLDAENIGCFQYRSSDSHLLSVILSEGTGQDAFSYARQHLFGPLGIKHTAWLPSPEGHSMGHIGLSLTSRDIAKLGICLLGGGLYEGRQVIPQSWLEEAFSKQTDGYPAYGDYGYQFWNGRISGQPYVLAHGHGGQQLWLLPELDSAVVFTAESAVSRWRNPRRLLEQHIIPAMNP
ncbi:beta-lactamase [Paenibacillus sp. FSL R7-0273]|uniref:serine hydrolase domain-containing protein n=1 Tax=Paenibacillus sp. FSL R7-0273 TaxID=1536772 RepID=UPI0004F75D6E|nr:serine hydrolase [Paenibacillus sp. FSL R7-0273]AIQ44871.1 beta-lactamase [Paenibacillus sp. FSL R7-0273]OMF93274.1 serine hydrolase [Paenibacillus sp. FSL R7-0273]